MQYFLFKLDNGPWNEFDKLELNTSPCIIVSTFNISFTPKNTQVIASTDKHNCVLHRYPIIYWYFLTTNISIDMEFNFTTYSLEPRNRQSWVNILTEHFFSPWQRTSHMLHCFQSIVRPLH